MICYLDMTFCTDTRCNCERKLTDGIKRAAAKWWGSDEAPISVSDKCFCDRHTEKPNA